MHRIDIKKEFKDMFPWHYDPLSSQKQDCPNLGKLDFDFSSLIEHVFELCKKQNPKTSGKGFSYYFENNAVKQNVIDNAVTFEKHTIGDTERPDTTSFLVYGDVKYDWIIFLTNKMMNPYFDWPLSSQDFTKMIRGKYGSVERAKKQIYEYRQIANIENNSED